MKDDDRTIVLDAARRIDAAAQQLGVAYRDMSESLALLGRKAYSENGRNAAEDFASACGQSRVEEEVAGVLLTVGLRDVLSAPIVRNAIPVADFYPRWKARIATLPESSSRSRPSGASRAHTIAHPTLVHPKAPPR